MVGRISLDTRVELYGKKRVSWERKQITEIPKPIEEQVVQIRTRLELFNERRLDIAQKEAAKLGRDVDLDEFDEDDEGL